MNRGEVWWVNFEPSIGGEIQKQRPAVIISNDSSNKSLNRLQVIPLTSKATRLYPSEALIHIQGKTNKALADQITTVSKQRLYDYVGSMSSEEMHKVEEAVKIQLNIQ